MKISSNNINKKSFSSRLSFYVIAFTAVLFLGASIVVYNYSRKLIYEEAMDKAFNQLRSTSLEIENVLLEISVAVDNLAESVVEEALSGNREKLFELTQKLVSYNDYIVGSDIGLIPYFFPDTKYFSPYSQKKGFSISTRQVGSDEYPYQYMDWYQIPRLLKRPYWTDPFFDEGAGNIIMCTYTHPLYDAGTFIGVLTADLSIDWLTEKVNSIKPYENSYNLMIGKSGAYIVHNEPKKILVETIFTTAETLEDPDIASLGKKMIQGEIGMENIKNNEGESYVFYAPVSRTGWSLAMVCPKVDVYGAVTEMGWLMVILSFVCLVLLYLINRKIIGVLAKPLVLFSESAKIIAQGNFNVPLPEIKTEDEIYDLRNSLVHMQDSLSEYVEQLETTTSAKERIESELNIARTIQMGMIPKVFPPFPNRQDIDLYAMLRPAKEVGGDLYDYFIENEKLYFAIGDVAGKGVPASLLMAVTRSLFRSFSSLIGNPKGIIESLNRAIAETNDQNMFVTMFIGVLNLKNGKLRFCNAGHNPPCIIDNNGEVAFMDIYKNLPLGAFPEFTYKDQEINLEPKQTIFLYTDGLTEAESPTKELYSDPKLLEVLKGKQNHSAEGIVVDIDQSVKEHVSIAPQSDDLTVLVIKFTEEFMNDCKKLVIQNQVSEINKLAEFIDGICEEAELPLPLTMNLNLAMEEAVSNVILYAYPNGEDNHTIEITYSKKVNEITFTIEDTGRYFDPTIQAEADITLSAEDRQIGGLGIFLVKQIMNTVTYRRDGDRNILTLTKIIE